MKIVSWAIIFVIVIFSFSFINRTILNDKMEIMKQEVKYNNILDLAVADATGELKAQMNNVADANYVESQDGILSVAKTFFDSFSLGFGYYGGNQKESIVKMYIPALAIMTYDGFYMYTLDNVADKYIEHTLKPEIKYMYNDGIQKLNFTLGNTVVLEKEVSTLDNSNPVMVYYDTEDNEYTSIEAIYSAGKTFSRMEQKVGADGSLIYYLKKTNTGNVVDLTHWYDIKQRSESSTWEEQIGNYIFEFRKQGEVCYTTNRKYKDIGSTTWNHTTDDDEKVIVYEKSFYTESSTRYLLEEWRKEKTGELLEQRMTEYTHEQLRFTQSIEAEISDVYGETDKYSGSGLTNWETYELQSGKTYKTYLTRGNPENEGSINLLTGEYEIGEFHKVRREQLTRQIKENLEYYVLLHNSFAQGKGITYNFTMPEVEDTDWENAITDMSVFAFVQGIPMVSGKYYNNYGIAGAKVIEQEKFYGIPPEEEQIETGKLPKYYSSYEIGSNRTYLFERNNARIFYDARNAADYGYFPNTDGSIAEVEAVERAVWDMNIIKYGFNCVKTGDTITIPLILSDSVVPAEIKWATGTQSRYYFSNAGNTKNRNSGTHSVHYDAGKLADDSIDKTIVNGTDIQWEYRNVGGERKILIIFDVGIITAQTTYTIYVRDYEGNSNVQSFTIRTVDSTDMTFSQDTSTYDGDISTYNLWGSIQNRNWTQIDKEFNTDTPMAYWRKGRYNVSDIIGYYDMLNEGRISELSGINRLQSSGTNRWNFSPGEYGVYTLFAWDCAGMPWAGIVYIFPTLQVTYRIDAYNGSTLVAEIYYDASNTINEMVIKAGSNTGTYDHDVRNLITEQITEGRVFVQVNRKHEYITENNYQKGNFTVDTYDTATGTNLTFLRRKWKYYKL